jgi:hypothetical protein
MHTLPTTQTPVDIVLGDASVLSRQHARIVYNFERKRWQLVVEVRVNQGSGAHRMRPRWFAVVATPVISTHTRHADNIT